MPNPNPGVATPDPATAEQPLTKAEEREAREILASVAFQQGMKDGFSCRPSYDATIRVDVPANPETLSQEISQCTAGPAAALKGLLERHRWLARGPH